MKTKPSPIGTPLTVTIRRVMVVKEKPVPARAGTGF
jgi:hypothetical protein